MSIHCQYYHYNNKAAAAEEDDDPQLLPAAPDERFNDSLNRFMKRHITGWLDDKRGAENGWFGVRWAGRAQVGTKVSLGRLEKNEHWQLILMSLYYSCTATCEYSCYADGYALGECSRVSVASCGRGWDTTWALLAYIDFHIIMFFECCRVIRNWTK